MMFDAHKAPSLTLRSGAARERQKMRANIEKSLVNTWNNTDEEENNDE
jgi:hypothetical protein